MVSGSRGLVTDVSHRATNPTRVSRRAALEGGTRRSAAAEQIVTSLGGTVEAYYFGFGGDDFYLIADLADNASAVAGALTASASG